MQEKLKLTSQKEKNFYAKINTTLLLYLYQIFIFLLGHLHFFLHFLFTFVENLFKKHPIHYVHSRSTTKKESDQCLPLIFFPLWEPTRERQSWAIDARQPPPHKHPFMATQMAKTARREQNRGKHKQRNGPSPPMDGRMDGWMDGWMNGWRIADGLMVS